MLFKKDTIDVLHWVLKFFPNRTFVLIGHSLGAAISTLSTFFLYEKFRNENIHCVTFGCPKIGNKDFAKGTSHTESQELNKYPDWGCLERKLQQLCMRESCYKWGKKDGQDIMQPKKLSINHVRNDTQ